MKKSFTLLLSIAASYCCAWAQQAEGVLREEKEKYFLSSMVTSDNFEDFYYRYDDNNRLMARDRFSNNRREMTDSIFYDDKGNIARVDRWTRLNVSGVEPSFQFRYKYEYDEQGRLYKRRMFMMPNMQQPTTERTYYYKEDGKPDYYNEISPLIGLDDKMVYSYDKEGRLERESLQSNFGEGYEERAFTVYTYPDKGTLPTELSYSTFNPTTSEFRLVKQDRYTYQDNSTLSYLAVNGESMNVFRIDYQLSMTDEYRELVVPSIPEDDATFFRYGFDYRRVSEKYYNYEGENTAYVRDRVYSYVRKTVGIDEVDNTEISTIVYPNPAADRVSIQGHGLKEITLFDVNGAVIRSMQVEADRVDMGVASLPRGTYFLQVRTTRGIESQSVLLR